MSSYFDRMARCIESPFETVRLVRDQYEAYLRDLSRDVVVKDADRFNSLARKFETFTDKVLRENDPVLILEDMHELAHELGSAKIQIRGRGYASDNPRLNY